MQKIKKWKALATPFPLLDIDLRCAKDAKTTVVREFEVASSGTLSGVAIYFKAELCDGIELSTSPDRVTDTNSWGGRVCIPSEPLEVRPGEQISLEYEYKPTGSAIRMARS